MSRNPFRRSIHVNTTASDLDADLPAAAEASLNVPDGKKPRLLQAQSLITFRIEPKPQQPKTKKTVRITSPPQSPPSTDPLADDSFEQRAVPARRSRSPLPVSDDSSDSDAPTDDPFEKHSDAIDDRIEDEAVADDRRQSADRVISTSAHLTPQNPFQRTLASIESSVTRQGLLQSNEGASEPSNTPGGKGAMDVDSFKRLLLTGNAAPPSSAPSATPPNSKTALGRALGDSSSSSTDTSSISRHSVFDASNDAHAESPRTSYEKSESEDETQDEKSSLMSSEKKQPPPPRPKHGKLLSQKGPQTVSFSDFAPTTSSPYPSQSLQESSPLRLNSDLNKPLPPPPPFSSSPELKPSVPWPEAPRETLPATSKRPVLSHRLSADSSASSSHKKQPPPDPLPRRHSQLRTNTQNRSRSNSSHNLPSQPEESFGKETSFPLPSSPSPAISKAPPPPPTRRGGALNKATPSPASLANDPSPSPRQSRSGTSSSTQRPHRVSNASSTSGPPPPPPPPRKTSNRPSLEGQRPFSSNASDSSRRSMDLPTPKMTSPPAEDVMKGMDDLQREVNELLAKAGK